MTTYTVDASQQKAAKVAGLAYLFFVIGSIVHYSVIELNLIVSDNASATAHFIQTNELLFRMGIGLDLLLFASGIILSLALYVILRTVHANLALLALILLLVQAAVSVVIEFSSVIALSLLSGEGYLTGFSTEQLQALVALSLKVRAAGYHIVILFFCPGSIIFYYLFLKSEYVPSKLAALGILSFSLMFVSTIVIITFPGIKETIPAVRIVASLSSVLGLLVHIFMGIWLLSKGLRVRDSNRLPRIPAGDTIE